MPKVWCTLSYYLKLKVFFFFSVLFCSPTYNWMKKDKYIYMKEPKS